MIEETEPNIWEGISRGGGAHLPKHKYERPMISTVIVGLTGAAPSVRVPDEHRLQASHKG